MTAVTAPLVGLTPGLEVPNATQPAAGSRPDKINSINDFILHQAQNIPDTPLIAYPRSEHGCSDWADYTAKDLDRFADEAAKELTALSLRPTVKSKHITKMRRVILMPAGKQE